MRPNIKTFFSLLAFRVGDLPLSALLLLAAGLLWLSFALFVRFLRVKRRRRAGRAKKTPAVSPFSLWEWLPAFLCTALGGCLLFLFCENGILAAGLLFLCALLHAALLAAAQALHRPSKPASEGGDSA